jgi:prolyl 4-hydroxylase
LYDRISEITTVPADNFEHLQMLKYEETEFYAAHHDLLGLDPVISACGPRILTFFIYLSDVEEGGETNFPELNMAVVPKKGRAVLWANVLDKDLETQDNLTKHEARPVIKGRKYGANSWIHLKNYREVNLWACSG